MVLLWIISMFLVSLFSLFTIGFFIYSKALTREEVKWVTILTLCICIWSFGRAMFGLSAQKNLAIFWVRSSYMGTIGIPIFFLQFVYSFLGKTDRRRNLIRFCYLLTALFWVSNFTRLFILDMKPKLSFSYFDVPGRAFQAFNLFYTVLIAYAHYELFRTYRVSTGLRRNQIKYLFLASLIGFGGAMTTFPLVFDIPLYPFGVVVIPFYPLILAYTVIRYKLFEIDTVIHRTILWLLTILILIMPVGLIHGLLRVWIANLHLAWVITIDTIILVIFLGYYHKLKPKIDHFFRRRKYDYYIVLGEISQKIGSELDINSVIARLFKELKEILYIRNGFVLVRQPDQLNYAESGSIGYESLLEAQKPEKATLSYQTPLSQWLQTHQKALEREQVEVDPQYEPIKQESLSFLNQSSIEVLIPVIMENKVNALLGIGKKENLQSYTIKDVELLEHMGRQIGITIDNALHHEDIVEKERLAEELKLGREIQMALLPQETPKISGLTVQGLMQPAKEIGGDYYDFVELTDGDLAIIIGDVSGKGVAAGLLMAMAKTAIHTLSQEETSPMQVLLRTNQILSKNIGGQKFMTMLYLKWQIQSKTLTYSSAGHEHILIYRAKDGIVEAIKSGGFMLGIIPDISPFLEDNFLSLSPEDKVILYTDGVTEARNEKEEFFTLQRLIQFISQHGRESANRLLTSIKKEVYNFIGTHEQYDDITLVILEIKE